MHLLSARAWRRSLRRRGQALSRPALVVAALLGGAAPAAAQTSVVTYHYDTDRSGWNATETVLTPQTVGGEGSGFGLLATVSLDGTVDAQPLVVPGVVIEGDPNAGNHDVVYVATEANTIFAIDPTVGTVLLSRNFGNNVPRTRGCGANDIGVGITGTPVIDTQRGLLYVVAYTRAQQRGGGTIPIYTLHALALATLADAVAPVVISASQTLIDGSTLAFSAGLQRQRPALLEYGNTIYTAFGSFCDNSPARGWVMGWAADTLLPLNPGAGGTPIGNLTNRDKTAPGGRFLSSIWMSGAGPAADANGVYYATGNSNNSASLYDPAYNVEHSLVRLSPDTGSVLDVFTPSNLPYLASRDLDFGSGGVMLLPGTAAGQPAMVAAAGKFGTLYLLDRTNLGGYTPGGPDNALAAVQIGKCWCAPAYFNDGTPTLVSSGGTRVTLWAVQATPLVRRAVSPPVATGPDPGFFTSVSSNGTSGTIVWAVTRPLGGGDSSVWLYAFGLGAGNKPLRQLFAAPAGTWNEANHNANIVPVVANGRAYVASDGALAIFGLAPAPGAAIRQ
jgi:hypothetical protein